MTFLLVPHQVTATAATIWVGAIDERDVGARSVRLEIGGEGDGRVIELDGSGWEWWQSFQDDDWKRFDPLNRTLYRALALIRSKRMPRKLDYQRVKVSGLEPRTSYSVQLRIDNQKTVGADKYLREGRVTTLPAVLPTKDEKPFTLLLGSCFYGPEDATGMVGATYRYLPEDERPDIKVLCGDQVYLDNPWRETTLKWYHGNQKPGVFRAMLFKKYVDNWTQLGGDDAGLRQLLGDGANYFCSDDHEFWNNAPNFGGVGLFNTLTRGQREWWFAEARRLFQAFQSPLPCIQFDVAPLSGCIIDTRINRDTKGERFMRDEDLEAVGQWIDRLQGPGILVVGQPILVEKTGVFRSLLRRGPKEVIRKYVDKNLPDYAQYENLVEHIKRSKHSIVALTGDVHYGRIAHGNLKPGSESKFIEVISSPMQAVLDDKGEPLFGTCKPAPTDYFPIVANRAIAPSQNHFVTVQFSSEESASVNMTVKSWPVPRPGEKVPQVSDPVFKTTLA
jgi:hypothetical protein